MERQMALAQYNSSRPRQALVRPIERAHAEARDAHVSRAASVGEGKRRRRDREERRERERENERGGPAGREVESKEELGPSSRKRS
eukprot:scaffold189122_cov30-Tisochrysis_lutea.AAC.6